MIYINSNVKYIFHLEELRKEGAEILEPSTKVKYIEISV